MNIDNETWLIYEGHGCDHLYSMAEIAKDEKTFYENYYDKFDNACEDLRYFVKNGK